MCDWRKGERASERYRERLRERKKERKKERRYSGKGTASGKKKMRDKNGKEWDRENEVPGELSWLVIITVTHPQRIDIKEG
jgi:hypothetical protein